MQAAKRQIEACGHSYILPEFKRTMGRLHEYDNPADIRMAENLALLDRRVICDLLGFDDDIYHGVRRLAQKWCAEPSVHGGKARPKDAKYVE